MLANGDAGALAAAAVMDDGTADGAAGASSASVVRPRTARIHAVREPVPSAYGAKAVSKYVSVGWEGS